MSLDIAESRLVIESAVVGCSHCCLHYHSNSVIAAGGDSGDGGDDGDCQTELPQQIHQPRQPRPISGTGHSSCGQWIYFIQQNIRKKFRISMDNNVTYISNSDSH